MSMPQFFVKYRRQRAVDRVVLNGKALRRARARRESINGAYDHTIVDASYLDGLIVQLERNIERDKDFIRKTAQEATN